MTTEKQMNFGVIGCGGAGLSHITQLHNNFEGQPYAICDINEESLSKVKKELSIRHATTDYRQLTSMDDVDIVIIAVPLKFHKEVLLEAAKNKKHILCEKPYAVDEKQAKEMNEAAAKNKDRMLSINYTLRQSQLYAELKKELQKGTIGKPISYTVISCGPGTNPKPFFPRHKRFDMNMTQNFGPAYESAAHYIDCFHYLFSQRIINIAAYGRRVEDYELPGIVFVLANNETKDMLVSFTVSWVYNYKSQKPISKGEIEIAGDEGVLSYSINKGQLTINSKAGLVEKKIELWDSVNFSMVHKDFIRSIEGGKVVEKLGSPKDGLWQSDVSAKIIESFNRSGRR